VGAGGASWGMTLLGVLAGNGVGFPANDDLVSGANWAYTARAQDVRVLV
jgi:hypothetical protein